MTDRDPELKAGLTHTARMTVEDRHTVPRVEPGWSSFADMPPVFATAMMVGFIEATCIEALGPYLTPGQRTVGTHVEVSHVAATPLGMTVTATVELLEVDGRSLRFSVACHDDAGLIGEGTHRRAVIDLERFNARLQARST